MAVDIEALRDRPLFLGLNEAQVTRLASRMRRRVVDPSEDVWPPGQPPPGLFVIARGAVELRPPGATEDQPGVIVREAGAFDKGFCDGFFGEASIVDPGRDCGRAIARERTVLYALTADDLAAALHDQTDLELVLLLNIARALSLRLRIRNENFAARPPGGPQ